MEIKQINNKKQIEQVVDLFMRVFAEPPYNEQWTREAALKRLIEIYKGGKDFCFYAESGKIVGAVFCRTQTWHEGVHVIGEDCVVDPAYRGKGIGAALTRKVEEKAKEKGIVSIDLLANTKSKAIDLWEKIGYTRNGYVQLMKKF